ncbi:DUF481 domain-containing protein [Vibrio sp. SM6]|uniref:DUF481 domain-containing protein n=1 Tax=Vibrio agarilyticus TaxID=2726741 RepID=A0A7X8TRJ0_9VIBR|nr:DUF481 domain-containing protein [Vibrio agarilyticus]
MPPVHGEAEFGYIAHSGNTESKALNTRLAGEYTIGRHRSSAEWRYFHLYKDGEEDSRTFTYAAQTDFKLGPKAYLYGNFQGVDSKYSAYFKDYTVSSGLGYQITNTETFLLEFEVGPGFRYQKPNTEEIDDDDLVFPEDVKEGIVRTHITSAWQVVDNLRLAADVTAVSGRSNMRIDSSISINNEITERIALKIAHSQAYHDRVPEGLYNSDSLFSVNVLFDF